MYKNKLFALHNLNIESFEKVLERNAFICPSIAITTKDNILGNSNYGNITVIFKDEITNPYLNENAVLLSGDGYTGMVNQHIIDSLSDNEAVELIKNEYNEQEAFIFIADENICKASAAVPISKDCAVSEIDRIVSLDDYIKYKDEFLDLYYDFLDKNFKGWDWTDTEKKYLTLTPYLEKNSISPSVQIGLKFAIKECSKYNTIPEKQKAIKDVCKKVGLKVTPKKINEIINFTEICRNAPIMYFEEKIFQAVPLSEIKGLVLPDNIPKEILDKLNQHNIKFSIYPIYGGDEERKNQILAFSNYSKEKTSTLDEKLNQVKQIKNNQEKTNKSVKQQDLEL